MDRIWKQIAGWPYEASSDGLIRNMRTGRVLRPDTIKGGYLRVTLSLHGVACRRLVHLLVCETFNGPMPSDKECARHLNGSSADNGAANLMWGTRHENEQDKRIHGTYQSGEKNPFAKLTQTQVDSIRQRYADDLTKRRADGFQQITHGFVAALAVEFSVHVTCIKFIVQGRNWKTAA